jgi:hypothetical protein
MAFSQTNGVRYFTFESLDDPDLIQAVFTRHGGVSPQPWSSLNMGGTVGDDPARVAENRRRAFQAVGRSPDSIYDVWQVHGREVVYANSPRSPDVAHRKADAILTDNPQVTLFMRFADCVPVFLFDPYQRVVGLAHAGWQGTVKRTVQAAVQAMQDTFHCKPADIRAAIGPSIGAHHYTVGPEVVAQVRETFGDRASDLIHTHNGGNPQFDLWEANRLLLENIGVLEIEVAAICTSCHLDDWFSHRGEHGKTGRFGALIGLGTGER